MNEYKQSDAKKEEIKKRKADRMAVKSKAQSDAAKKRHLKKEIAINKAKEIAENDRKNPMIPIETQQQLAMARAVTHHVQQKQRMKMKRKIDSAPKEDALMDLASESVLKKAEDEGVDLNNMSN